jgi:hypothetical protein
LLVTFCPYGSTPESGLRRCKLKRRSRSLQLDATSKCISSGVPFCLRYVEERPDIAPKLNLYRMGLAVVKRLAGLSSWLSEFTQ